MPAGFIVFIVIAYVWYVRKATEWLIISRFAENPNVFYDSFFGVICEMTAGKQKTSKEHFKELEEFQKFEDRVEKLQRKNR